METGNKTLETDVLAAVVDQIPLPSEGTKTIWKDSDDAVPNGMEGISISIDDSCFAASDLWLSDGISETLRDHTTDEAGVLSFYLQDEELDLRNQEPRVSCTYHLPLSNTTFRNGQASTLLAQRWRVVPTPTGTETICTREKALSHRQLRLPPLARLRQNVVIQSRPWHYLTPPCVVAKSAGNVVRRLAKNDSFDEIFPASEELEVAISSLLASEQEFPRHLGIWAQVTPKANRTERPYVQNGIGRAVLRGDRLLKVLSGGGGWGEKKGLIALDPGSSFYPQSVDSDQSMDMPFNPILQQGDMLRFIGICYSDPSHVIPSDVPDEKFIIVNAQRSLRFGSAFPLIEAPTIGAKVLDECILVVYNHFGALSDYGSSLSIDLHLKGQTQFGCQSLGNIVTTKLPPLFGLQYLDHSSDSTV